MLFAAALLAFSPLAFLVLSVKAQTSGGLLFVNTATGLVFEDYDPVSSQYGNPIVGAPYDPSHAVGQTWELVVMNEPVYSLGLRNNRSSGESIFIRANAFRPWPGLEAHNTSSAFGFDLPFGNDNGILAFVTATGLPLAITAPTVANGQLSLQPYNAADFYQHWAFISTSVSTSISDFLRVTVANPIVGSEDRSSKL